MEQKDFTPDRLSRRSGVSKATIVNWKEGTVGRPRDWRHVVDIARALELERDEVNTLLEAAELPNITMLLTMHLVKEDSDHLEPWSETSRHIPIPLEEPVSERLITTGPSTVPPAKWKRVLISGSLVLLVIIGVVGVYLFLPSSKPPIWWQENFNPIKGSWDQPSAKWEDLEGPGAVLVENNPTKDFGKVESEVITVDVDTYPILRVVVSKVDLSASYNVQLLDKKTGALKVIIKPAEYHDQYAINLADEMGWQGSHSFTINIWISGEGKSATFDLVSIEAN